MASYSFLAPRPTNAILSDVDHIRKIQWILAQLNPSLADDAPEDSKRLVPLDIAKTQYRFERLVDSSWKSVGKLMHDVDTLDGYHASTSAVMNTIPVYNADAKLVGDLTGNANTATTLRNVRKFQIGGIASGGSVNFDGSADATIEITQLTVNNANDTAINGVLSIKHGGTGGADAATARANLGVPAIDHSSTAKTFGVASTTKYGHAIGSDAPNSTFTADNGYFFSPKGADDLNISLRAFIAQEVAKYLPLSGGVLTGGIDFNGNSITQLKQLEFIGAGHGGYIDFHFDGSNSDYTSRIIESAIGRLDLSAPNGVFVNNSSVLTSAGGFLNAPLTGQQIATIGADVRSMFIGGANGLNENAPLLCLDGPNGDSPGRWYLLASNGSQRSWLSGLPDGTLELNGASVLTSAGGTLYAPLFFYGIGSAYYSGDAAAESMNVGLLEENVGRSAVLSLRTSRATDAPGSFWLGARNSTSEYYLTGTPDGWLGWGGNTVLTSAGGTVGTLVSSADTTITKPTNTSRLLFTSAPVWTDGAWMHLGAKNSSYDGEFQISSRLLNGQIGNLVGSGTTLEWCGYPVLTRVASWRSGSNWYRKWSDGWIEQGGISPAGTVTLHLPFSDTNYTVVNATVGWQETCIIEGSRTTTSFRIKQPKADESPLYDVPWYACGY